MVILKVECGFRFSFFFFLMLFIFLSGSHFINKMSFGPTFFNQNYTDYPVGETLVDNYWLFRYIYVYIYIYSFYLCLIVWMLICECWFYAVLLREVSGRMIAVIR